MSSVGSAARIVEPIRLPVGQHQATAWVIAAYGLPGSRLGEPTAPLADTDWRALVPVLVRHRLVGLLASAVSADRFPVTEPQRRELVELDAAAAVTALRLDRVLLEVADMFDDASIPFRVLKGSALAYTCYPDPRQRPYGDVDVLVPSERFDHAIALLTAAGGRAKYTEPRPGFVRRFGKGLSIRRPDGLEVDVHRTFVSGPWGLSIELGELFERGIAFRVGGRELLGLAREERFLHACYHAALGASPPRVLPLRDVAQLALDQDLDVERVHVLLDRWGATAIAAAAIATAWQQLQLADAGPLSSFAAAYEPTAREARALAAYSTPRQRYARQAVATLSSIPRARDRVAYLRALLLPSRDYLAGRDRSYLGRFARAVRIKRTLDREA